MPSEAMVSIFTDNDLTDINDDHFEINLVACLLNQIYVVPIPPPRYDYYDDPHANVTDEPIPKYFYRCNSLGTTVFIYNMMYYTLMVFEYDYVWICYFT